MSDLPFDYPDAQGPSLTGAVGKLKKCRRHEWVEQVFDRFGIPVRVSDGDPPQTSSGWVGPAICRRCGAIRDEARSRRGKQSRNYGNRAELSAARKYGGQKIGAAGGPVDIRGADFNTQVKTHRRLPPLEWRKAFAKMAEKGERQPRLLLRFVQGPGLPPVDYFVFQADDFLDWFGRDEERDRNA